MKKFNTEITNGYSLIFDGFENKIKKGITDPIDANSARVFKSEKTIKAKNCFLLLLVESFQSVRRSSATPFR